MVIVDSSGDEEEDGAARKRLRLLKEEADDEGTTAIIEEAEDEGEDEMVLAALLTLEELVETGAAIELDVADDDVESAFEKIERRDGRTAMTEEERDDETIGGASGTRAMGFAVDLDEDEEARTMICPLRRF